MIKINLLPVRAAKKKETFMNQIYVGILVLVLVFAGVGWRAYSRKAEISRLDKEIVDRKKELDDLKGIVKKVEEFEAKKQVLEQKIALIEDLEKGRDYFIQIIDQISQVIPGGLWVTGLSFKGAKGASKQSSTISVKGSAYEKDDVGIFIANLNANKDFIKEARLLSLTSSRAKEGAATELYNYDIVIVPKVEEKAAPEPETKGKKKR
jgi:type IV pilus assembly protein PilN